MEDQIAEKLIREELELKSGFLDIGNLSLSQLPILLKECTHLTKLVIGNYSNAERKRKGWEEVLSKERKLLNTFSNCVIVSSLVQLEELYIRSINIYDLSFIGALSNLKKLDIQNTYIYSVAPLLNCKKIKSLSITRDQIVDFGEIYKLHTLKELNIFYNPQKFNKTLSLDLKGIENLKDLKILVIITENGTEVENGSALNKLNKLEELHLF